MAPLDGFCGAGDVPAAETVSTDGAKEDLMISWCPITAKVTKK